MNDLISRQAAIDALCDEYCGGWKDCKHYPKCENLKAIQNLCASTQPEIIRCKDCKYWGIDGYKAGCKYAIGIMMGNDYCSMAERKAEE